MTAHRVVRPLFLAVASVVFLAYVLSPIFWLVSSSFQSEAEITSKPPHWLPHEPTTENFRAIFQADREVTYENRRQGDTATGGYIPSTAKNLLPSMWNSLLVAIAVVVLNLLVAVPAAYAMAKIRYVGRSASIYLMLTTRVIPDIALVVPFFLFIREFLLALMFTQTAASQTMPIVVASFTSDFTISFSFINAAGVLAIVPPVILAILFERYIVSGLTAGAVKG